MKPMGCERLESRRLLSASLSLDGTTLNVVGDNLSQVLTITDLLPGNQATVSFDANGNGILTDPGDYDAVVLGPIETFNIDLKGGDDDVLIEMAGFPYPDYDGVSKHFNVELGGGADSFEFRADIGNLIVDSTVSFDIDAGAGDDFSRIVLNHVNDSLFDVQYAGGSGDDEVIFTSDDFNNSVATLEFDLGSGNDSFLEAHEEGTHFNGSNTTRVFGGAGDDDLRFSVTPNEGPYEVTELLSVELYGGNGNDEISFVAAPFLLNDSGGLRLVGEGGNGNDTLDAWIDIDAASTGGTLVALLRGGNGNDSFDIELDVDSLLVDYDATLEGGNGFDTALTAGNGTIVEQSIEA